MKLIIDIGNTRVKIAVFREDKILEIVNTEMLQLEQLQGLLIKYPNIKSAILSAVKPYAEEVNSFLQAQLYFLKLDFSTPVPFKNLYRSPQTLGKDRMAIAAASQALFPKENVLAIVAGTTITYDMVNQLGEYLGGSISPGIHMRFRALHTFTDQLPFVETRPGNEVSLIGVNTQQAIHSGVIQGVKAEVDGIIKQYRITFPDLRVVLGGGDYKYFDKRVKNNIFASPNIVLVGLKEILIFNEKK